MAHENRAEARRAIEQGYEAARYAALSNLVVIKYALGDLDRMEPTRAAIGGQGLAVNHSVEIVLTVLFNGTGANPPPARGRYAQ